MTIERTQAPPKVKPLFKCNHKSCNNMWTAYHGKVGCLCEKCEKERDHDDRRTFNEARDTMARTRISAD